MAITDNKRDVYLGQTVEEQVRNIDENFTELYDNEDDLQTQINGKEPKISSKGTAFNKNYATADPVMDGTASAGVADTIARGDHRHPTDTSRLAVKPDGTNTLLDSNNKIRTIYLSDEVLGQLAYQGTFDATAGVTGYTAKKGDYYICSKAGSKNPDGTTATASYAVGDWAVYNGTGWDKVDNTDAVTMVNGQIGAVEIYKGSYSSAAAYHKGDIVLSNSCLYLFINATATAGKAVTDGDYWKIFGKVYSNATTTTDGLMSKTDKANVDANTSARHSHSNKALLDTYAQTEANLADAVSKKHSHSNLTLLETYDQTNANIKDAVTKKHSHSNKTVLDNTTASYTTEEKTKLGQIDASLLGKTADQLAPVKDVIFGAESCVKNGVATIQEYGEYYVTESATSSAWSSATLNGANYYRLLCEGQPLNVFNENGEQIVVLIKMEKDTNANNQYYIYCKNKQKISYTYLGYYEA